MFRLTLDHSHGISMYDQQKSWFFIEQRVAYNASPTLQQCTLAFAEGNLLGKQIMKKTLQGTNIPSSYLSVKTYICHHLADRWSPSEKKVMCGTYVCLLINESPLILKTKMYKIFERLHSSVLFPGSKRIKRCALVVDPNLATSIVARWCSPSLLLSLLNILNT